MLLSIALGLAGLIVTSLFIHSYFDWTAWKRDADIIGDDHPDFPSTDYSYWYFIRYEYWRK